MNAITLYDFEFDEGCYKVRLILAAMGIAFERIAVNMIPGAEQRRLPLLALNPLGTLPILIDRSAGTPLVLRDAEAIMAYLAQRHEPERTWLPRAPDGFGQVMTWLTFSARDLAAPVLARRHAMFGEPADAVATQAASLRCFRVMDDHMTAREFDDAAWFVGDGPTLADLALFPSIALSRDIGIDHEAYPALRRWMRRVRTLTGFSTMPGIPDYQ